MLSSSKGSLHCQGLLADHGTMPWHIRTGVLRLAVWEEGRPSVSPADLLEVALRRVLRLFRDAFLPGPWAP